MTDHEITPPPELVEQWTELPLSQEEQLVVAARWGADQELEACCEWLDQNTGRWDLLAELRAARRPKPPSLKEQALQAAQRFYAKGHENCTDEEVKDDFDTIRRALEQLDD